MKTKNTYIALLRGINVLGKNIIKMDALRKMMEDAGFQDVKTYIQSGNVVFKAGNTSLTEITKGITEEIQQEFGFRVPVIVLDTVTLRRIIEGNPLAGEPGLDPGKMHVTFLASPPPPFDREAIEMKKLDGEHIAFSELAVYLYCPHGYGKTKLGNDFLEKKLKVTATTRNWRTTLELMKMSQDFSWQAR